VTETTTDETTDDGDDADSGGRVPRGMARERMLTAGVELLIGDPPDLGRVLTVRDITTQAGVSEGVFYNHWPTGQDPQRRPLDLYVEDLLDTIAAQPIEWGTSDIVSEIMGVAQEGHTLNEVVRLASLASVETVVKMTTWRMQLMLTAANSHTDRITTRRDSWKRMMELMELMFHTILEATDRQMRSPMTVKLWVEGLAALSEGLSVHLLATGDQTLIADEDGHGWNHLGIVTLAMLPSVTAPASEEEPASLWSIARDQLPVLSSPLDALVEDD
jgi:AcrR family transcriptional regulator